MKSGFKGLPALACTLMAALMLLLAVSCGKKQDAAAAAEQAAGGAAAQVFPVSTVIAEKGTISNYIKLSGDIEAVSSIDAVSSVAGKITKVYVSLGQTVKKGDPIASIDPSNPDYVEHIVQARAPISGVISDLPAEVGMTISEADIDTKPLAAITAGGILEVTLDAPEQYISKIENGLECQISLDAFPGETFEGAVYEISPTVDVAVRTERVKVSVDNSSSKLKAGMFAKVKIITQVKDDVVKIPSDAIVSAGGKSVVFIVESDPKNPSALIARQTEVGVGIEIDGFAEITSGVQAGDEIVGKGALPLSDGVQINVQNSRSDNNQSLEGK